MGYIPKNARWYLAEIVLEYIVEDDPRNVVHVNIHLVEAGSPEEAYEKALALGRDEAIEYANTDGKMVRSVFRALRDLNVIHDELADGAELIYHEAIDLPKHKVREWIKDKPQLGVFAPIEPARGPNRALSRGGHVQDSASANRGKRRAKLFHNHAK